MVTDSAASEEVICGPGGVLEGAHPGLILIDMGSIAPEMSRSIAARAKAKGVPMLDAPVTGAPKVASEGKLGIMAGGPKETFDACLPIFQAMGVKIIHVGENGKGTTLKLINNLIMGVAIEAVAEALVLAAKAGIDPREGRGDHLRRRRPHRGHGDPRAENDPARFFPSFFRKQHVQGSVQRP